LSRATRSTIWGADAWQQDEPARSPAAWVSLYSGADLERSFHTALQGVWPYELARLPGNRFLLAGASWGELSRLVVREDKTVAVVAEPNPGVAVVNRPIFDKQQGKADGYFLLMEYCDPGEDGKK
jgi:hypothetical protein